MPRADGSLTVGQALALGAAQGPTELLPISSSAHTTLIAELAGWPYRQLDARSRKSFELALHGGAGLALLIAVPARRGLFAGASGRRRLLAIGLALAPPAIAGATLRTRIERHLGGRRAVAASLLAGALAMALADARADDGRHCAEAGAVDGVVLGLAQALALVPGVSRSGAALTAARARGFGRSGAQSLSLSLAVPLLIGAGVADGAGLAGARGAPHRGARAGRGADGAVRAAGGGVRAAGGGVRAAGGAAAFLSTLLSARLLLRAGGRRGQRLLPYAAYRALLAGVLLTRRPGASAGTG
jgi:undecaprenyl-diphosphatase